MDTKWKRFSYSLTAKIIAFLLVIVCYSGLLCVGMGIGIRNIDFGAAAEESYFHSSDYSNVCNEVVQAMTAVIGEYKSEENILNSGTVSVKEMKSRENQLYKEFEAESDKYDPDLTEEENYAVFWKEYAERILQAKEDLIQADLRDYRNIMQRLSAREGVVYFAQRGETVFTNSPEHSWDHFTANPAYVLFDGYKEEMFPHEVYFYSTVRIEEGDTIYIGFTDEFLTPRMAEWQNSKTQAVNSLYWLVGIGIALVAVFIFLLFVTGRKPQDDKIHLNDYVDRIYNDINLGLCAGLIFAWLASMVFFMRTEQVELLFLVTLVIAAAGLILVLSLVKHIKNRTFFTYTLTCKIFYPLFAWVKEVFNSGTTAVKVILVIIIYPVIAGLGFIMLPLTIAVAAWLALKRVQEFEAIKSGVKKVKEGDYHHMIDIPGDGEFARLAADINSISDGLSKAVENEIKSERLKSELITNVSHDIRTPLTSIITYVDLLKNEQETEKIAEYVLILEEKAQRLKVLTDDLFEATKASSGSIPVNLEKIDPVSLIAQGLGEFDEQIQERHLDFKFSHPEEKILVKADGKLLGRAIENLFLNICKYALEGSRVYIDIIDQGAEAAIVFKNISAYPLNISAEELMERFKRGDESRSSQGSGLGLSIAESLLKVQNGRFSIEVDGDLFKATITLPKDN